MDKLERVNGYKCLECDTVIEEVDVIINFKTSYPVEEFVEMGDITIEEVIDRLELHVICPNCGCSLQ